MARGRSSGAGTVIIIDRRCFLNAAGGLALGVAAGGAAPSRAAKPPAVRLNAYVQVTPAGDVFIVTPGAEMGQGISNSLPKIVAEEMDADWSRVTVQLSGADPAFASPKSKRQRSASSDGVTSYFDAMRQVGAATRAMLVAAAAARWGVDPATVTADQGRLLHAPSGRSVGFGDVASAAATLPPPAAVVLKKPEEFRLIGHDFPRKDIPAKIRGTAVFGMDVVLPGMLYAAIRHAPGAGATLASFDAAKAQASPGVRSIIQVDNAVGVIADSFWLASKAADTLILKVAGRTALDTEALRALHWAALDKADDDRPFPVDFDESGKFVDGSPAAAIDASIAAAPIRLSFDYEVPHLAHAALEPICATAIVTADRAELWIPSQAADVVPMVVAEATGLPVSAIRINRTALGGGFGRKNERDFVRQVTLLAKAVPGRPVMLVWSRAEDMQNDFYRPLFTARMRAGVAADGKILAMAGRIAGQPMTSGGRFRVQGLADGATGFGLVPHCYSIGSRRIGAAEVQTPLRTGFWRGVAGSQNGFFSESVIDEIAAALGRDPLDYRRAILKPDPRGEAVLTTVADKAGWRRPLPPGWGRGVAFGSDWGSKCAQVVEVEVVGKRLIVHRIVCAFDCGLAIDPDNVIAQIEGALLFGLSAALAGQVTLQDGAVVESSFADYRVVTMANTPALEVHLVRSGAPAGGVGEAGVPGVAPALAAAIHMATGQRIRRLPFSASGFEV